MVEILVGLAIAGALFVSTARTAWKNPTSSRMVQLVLLKHLLEDGLKETIDRRNDCGSTMR